MTLNPEATSMLSLFCEMLCVLAQLTNNAAQAAAILLRKRRVVGFIVGDLPFVPNPPNLCNAYFGFRYVICFVPAWRLRPAVLQSIPQRGQCERKQRPNQLRRRLPAGARRSSGLKSIAVPTARQDR